MKIRQYLEETKMPSLEERIDNLKYRIKEAEKGDGTRGEIQAYRRELRDLQSQLKK